AAELRQGDPRLHREEPAAQRDQRALELARRQGDGLDPRPPRRQPERHRRRADERRHLLVAHRQRDRHARRLPGGFVMARELINLPAKAKRGEVITVKTLISHVMETGFRHNSSTGELLPRDIITSFAATYNGEEIFRADLYPAIAANPFITFTTVATESRTIEFPWESDNGFSATEPAKITVERARENHN